MYLRGQCFGRRMFTVNYLESVEYCKVEGRQPCLPLRIYALSTCAFCEKAMNFLKNHDYPFEYLFLDLIDQELKKNIKATLKEQHGNIALFPLLVVNGEKAVSGFTEKDWRELLSVE